MPRSNVAFSFEGCHETKRCGVLPKTGTQKLNFSAPGLAEHGPRALRYSRELWRPLGRKLFIGIILDSLKKASRHNRWVLKGHRQGAPRGSQGPCGIVFPVQKQRRASGHSETLVQTHWLPQCRQPACAGLWPGLWLAPATQLSDVDTAGSRCTIGCHESCLSHPKCPSILQSKLT